MALPNLGKMKDEDYKQLTPEQLMMYNKDLPQMDYENPYSYQAYPRAKYQLINLADGSKRLVSRIVANSTEDATLCAEGDWRNSAGDWGVETAPAATPLFQDGGYSFDIPASKVAAAAAASVGADAEAADAAKPVDDSPRRKARS